MKATLFFTATLGIALVGAPAAAQDGDDAPPHITAGITGGTLGVGPEVGVRISPSIGVRASASFLNLSHDFDVDDIDYNGKAKLESYGAVLDVYPFKSGLRISGGFRIDKNRVRVTSTPTSNVTVGDLTFTPAQIGTLSTDIDTREFVPLATVGYAGGLTRGVKFGIDAGVMFQGSPRVKSLTSTGTLASDPTFQTELAKERVRLNDKVDDYKLYPVVQLSLFYAF